jgi:hypothetical protein
MSKVPLYVLTECAALQALSVALGFVAAPQPAMHQNQGAILCVFRFLGFL